jgi:hypothetical protein
MADTPLTAQELQKIFPNNTIATQVRTGVTLTNRTYGGGRGSASAYANYSADEAAAATDAPSVKKDVIKVGGNKEKTFAPSTNPLDQYSSYTYGLTLHVLTRDDYNAMVDSPATFRPTKTLISSAGRYRDSSTVGGYNGIPERVLGRDPAFKEDFYFDDLSIETIVGMTANTRGTNAISLKFTIIEPYGMTLIDRIMDVNNSGLNGKNYLEMPYLLEISFFGADETGKLQQVEDQTKWIPIKLLSVKIKSGIKGSEYNIEAAPFNHAANLETVQSIKTRMNITATSVADYFSADLDVEGANKSVTDAIAEDKKRKVAPPPLTTNDTPAAAGDTSGVMAFDPNGNPGLGTEKPRLPAMTADTVEQPPIVVNAKSFVAAYNAWFRSQAKNGNIGFADQIKFVFLNKDVENSKIVDAKKSSVRRVAAAGAAASAKANEGKDATTVDFDSVVHDLEAGTKVNDIINLVIPQSEFFLSQAIDSSTTAKTSSGTASGGDVIQQQATPVKLWKIVPSIKLGDFDPERNVWGKTITFYISDYLVYQQRDDRLPKSPPPTPVKRYDYMYTGHNTSVINFDIDFNMLYYTAKDVDRGKTNTTTGASSKPEESQNKDKPDSLVNNQQVAPEVSHPVANDYTTGAGGAVNRSETINTKSALNNLYTSARGDMLNLQLQIIGDPEFIKQDDLFISPGVVDKLNADKNNNDPYVPGTRSLAMDTGEIACLVTFKTPTDFDDSTGLYNLDSTKYRTSEFSGLYRVITVTSEFKSGKFTQKLNMVRYPMQDSVNKSKANDSVTSLGDALRKEPTNAEQKAASSRVSKQTLDVTKPAETPTQASPSIVTASGADLDAAYNYQSSNAGTAMQASTNTSVLQALGANNQAAAPESNLADVTSNAPTTDVSNPVPVFNAGPETTGSDNGTALA